MHHLNINITNAATFFGPTSLLDYSSLIFGIKYLVFDTYEIFCMKYL